MEWKWKMIIKNENNLVTDPNEEFNLNTIKFPTIEVPKYYYSYEVWLEFRDTFESLIHKNITNIQNIHYLRASLHGEAVQVILSIEFCINHYDNTRLLIHNHLRSIFSLNDLKRESTHDKKFK